MTSEAAAIADVLSATFTDPERADRYAAELARLLAVESWQVFTFHGTDGICRVWIHPRTEAERARYAVIESGAFHPEAMLRARRRLGHSRCGEASAVTGRAVDHDVQPNVTSESGRSAHQGFGRAANTHNADGVPWLVPALAPKRKSREASLRAERDYLRYALERLQAQVDLLESLTGCELATLIQRYQKIGRRYS